VNAASAVGDASVATRIGFPPGAEGEPAFVSRPLMETLMGVAETVVMADLLVKGSSASLRKQTCLNLDGARTRVCRGAHGCSVRDSRTPAGARRDRLSATRSSIARSSNPQEQVLTRRWAMMSGAAMLIALAIAVVLIVAK
jgi:hypothetical protein